MQVVERAHRWAQGLALPCPCSSAPFCRGLACPVRPTWVWAGPLCLSSVVTAVTPNKPFLTKQRCVRVCVCVCAPPSGSPGWAHQGRAMHPGWGRGLWVVSLCVSPEVPQLTVGVLLSEPPAQAPSTPALPGHLARTRAQAEPAGGETRPRGTLAVLVTPGRCGHRAGSPCWWVGSGARLPVGSAGEGQGRALVPPVCVLSSPPAIRYRGVLQSPEVAVTPTPRKQRGLRLAQGCTAGEI